MNNVQVLHLVSNSTTFPSNTANEFKINFNTPFDLTGKQVALVNATMTKAQSNIMEEKISFKFFPPRGPLVAKDFAPGESSDLITEEQYYNRFTGNLTSENGQVLMTSKATYKIRSAEALPNTLTIMVENKTDYEAKIQYYYFNEAQLEADKGWQRSNFGTRTLNNLNGGAYPRIKSIVLKQIHANGGKLQSYSIPPKKKTYVLFYVSLTEYSVISLIKKMVPLP